MSNDYHNQLKALCEAEDWSKALELWSAAEAQNQLNPVYIFAGMQIAAAQWRPDIQQLASAKLLEMTIPPQALIQVLQTAADYYQYDTVRTLIHYALDNNCYDQTTIFAMASIASRFNAIDLAVQCNVKASELGLDAAMVSNNQATMALFTGDKDQCEKLLKTSLSLNPKLIEAHYTLANLKTWSTTDNHIKTLKSLLPSTSEMIHKAQLYYALAKEYEDCARFDEAFEAMQAGAKIIKHATGYDVQTDKLFLQAIERNYPLQKQATKVQSSCTPIFICGLPRTGSTLFEKMLAQHSKISSAGELNQFAALFMRRANKQFANQQLSMSAMVEASTELDYESLGRDYLYSLDPQLTQTQYMIDKMPQNSLFVGPILSALPQSKVILVDRHPLDACVAMYKQIFNGIYDFSYDLNDLGIYVSQMRQLMQHWQNAYPDNVFVIRYEELVSNTEHTLRAACRFLNIDFETECLQQHTSADVSTTASAAQVRKKVYSSSIGKWQAYEKHLGVLEKYFPQ